MFHNVSGICQPHFRVSMPSLSSFFAPCLAIRPAGGELDGGGRKGEEREGERGSIMRGHGLSPRLALPSPGWPSMSALLAMRIYASLPRAVGLVLH